MKSKYASILNNLNAMQQSHVYALRKHILTEAEQVIVTLEKELQAAEAKIAMLISAMEQVSTDLYGQELMKLRRDALSATSESSAKFLAGVRAEVLVELMRRLNDNDESVSWNIGDMIEELRGGGK